MVLVHSTRACAFELACDLSQHLTGSLPLAAGLQVFNLGEVHAVQQEFGRMQPTQLFLDGLVDVLVVRHGGLPAHAANQAQCFHVSAFSLAVW